MDMIELGSTKEKISIIGQGTWKMDKNPQSEITAIKKGIELGMNLIDTAELYGTEHIVKAAIDGNLNKVFIATKVSPNHFRYEDIIKSCDASLKNLGIKTIDLYQLHWPSANIPIKDTMRAMEELVKQGKIRHIGVSNFSVQEMKDAQSALKNNVIVSNQVEYNMVSRYIEEDIMQYCKQEKITVIAYSPLARGAIMQKYPKLSDLLTQMAKKYNKTKSQLALNWIISHGNITAIPKASSIDHVVDNAGAAGWKMSKEDTEVITRFLAV